MKPILIDSSALVALINILDADHQKAVSISQKLTSGNRLLYLPEAIFTETMNVLGKKTGHKTAIQAAYELRSSPIFYFVETNDTVLGLAIQKWAHQSAAVSFTDCLVMAFADAYKTQEIFGFDEVFRKNGYLLPEPEEKQAA